MTSSDPATPFFGRESELQRLLEVTRKKTASIVVIKGRRRVGKSRLTEELAGRLPRYTAVHFQGLPPEKRLTAQEEREDFAQQLSQQLNMPPPRADDWNVLLWSLADRVRTGRWLIVLDEINWLGMRDPAFLGKLKNAWDLRLSKNPQLILILSGSVSSWIERKILHHTGFVGRISVDMTLSELPLHVCNKFWGAQAGRVSAYEKFRMLGVTGGIPRYLEEMDPTQSTDTNIRRLCFTQEGLLFDEFNRIFSDFFNRRNAVYRKILAALVDGPSDLEGLYEALKVGKGGKVMEYAEDLVSSGLLSRDYSWSLKTGHEGKYSRFRLSDNYCRFYLKYIEPNRQRIQRGTLRRLPNLDGILGLQFENLVLRNRLAIIERLGIELDDVVYDNPFVQRKTQRHRGCQIDYMIQTRHRTLYVCEIKFSNGVVPASVIKEVEHKVDCLEMPRRMTWRPVLIHVGEVVPAVAEAGVATIDCSDLLR
jgi:AAA+ ATPase superfamily predicted ATPase